MNPALAAKAGPAFRVSPSRIARYFFHECDRYLRFIAATGPQRKAEGIPAPEPDRSLITRALLEGGNQWEAAILDRHLADRALIADAENDTLRHERRHDTAATLDLLSSAEPGEVIYQGTIAASPAFYAAYGLDPDLVAFVDCHPDLIEVVDSEDGRLELRVIDAKASEMMKLSHRIQVALYSILLDAALTEAGLDDRLYVSREGGVWLYGQGEPEWFDLARIRPALETFLAHELTPLLRTPPAEAFWHLYFRCEWCDYYGHCRAEADATDDVSLVPYLSTFAKRHLLERAGVRTVTDLHDLLQRPDAEDVLVGCGSLEGSAGRLRLAVDALRSGTPHPTGTASIGLPRGEHVRLVITVQSEPLTGALYGWAVNRVGGNDLLGTDDRTRSAAAPDSSDDALGAVRSGLVDALMTVARSRHAHNTANAEDWQAQKTVQAYVFDTYERDLLVQALLEEALGGVRQAEALAPAVLVPASRPRRRRGPPRQRGVLPGDRAHPGAAATAGRTARFKARPL